MKEDSFKYDWDWIKDVGEYILNDPFMQSHRGREYAIKIGLIKEDCPSCANIDSIYEDKKEIKDIIKNESEIPQQQNRSKQEELNEFKNKLTLDGITTDFLGIHNYTKDIDVRMTSINNQNSFESMFI